MQAAEAPCCRSASLSYPWLHQHASFRAHRLLDFFVRHVIAQQHFMMALARGYHRKTIGEIGYPTVENYRLPDGNHLLDGIVELGRLLASDPDASIGLAQLNEVGQGLHVAFREAISMEKLLPLAHHAHVLIVENEDLDRQAVLDCRRHFLHGHQNRSVSG